MDAAHPVFAPEVKGQDWNLKVSRFLWQPILGGAAVPPCPKKRDGRSEDRCAVLAAAGEVRGIGDSFFYSLSD